MGQLLAIAPIAVPVLFWAAYHYHKDRHLPEPPGNLVLTLLLGMLAAGISAALYEGLGAVGLRFVRGVLFSRHQHRRRADGAGERGRGELRRVVAGVGEE